MKHVSRNLFDSKLFLYRRNSALKKSDIVFKNPWFLHDFAADGAIETINTIKQNFENCLEVFSCKNQFRQKLSENDFIGSNKKIANLIEYEPSAYFDAQFDCISEIPNLPLNEKSYDLIIANSGLNWVNDLPSFLKQIRASLRDDGCFIASFIGNHSLQELRQTFMNCEINQTGGVSMRISPMIELEAAVKLLSHAGFKMPVSSVESLKVRYDNVFGLFRDIKAMGENAAFYDKNAKPLNRKLIANIADYYQENYSNDDGRIYASFEIVTICGWA